MPPAVPNHSTFLSFSPLVLVALAATALFVSGEDLSEAGTGPTFGRVHQFQKEIGDHVQKDCSKVVPAPPATNALAPDSDAFDPELLLQEWIKSPPSDTCGHWQDSYASLQLDIRTGTPGVQRRYMTLANPEKMPAKFARPGLGDYLIGMVSTFLAALLTERAFIMEDSPLTEVVEAGMVDWRVGSDVPISGGDKKSVVNLGFYNKGKIGVGGWRDCVIFPANITEYFTTPDLDSVANIRVGTNGGILSRVFRNKTSDTHKALHALGLRMPTAFGCVLRFILKPKEEVWRMIVPQVAQLRHHKTVTIGIHLRTSDDFAFQQKGYSTEQAYKVINASLLRCAAETASYEVPEGYIARWLFLSDSSQVRDVVHLRHSKEVIKTSIQPAHPEFHGKGTFASVLAEWLLLSLCHHFVITESGFAKSAVAYNIQRPKIFLYDHFKFGGGKGACDQGKPDSLLEFTSWSGL